MMDNRNTSYMNKNQIWELCLQSLRTLLQEHTFETWIAPLLPLKFEDNTLTLQIPSRLFYQHIEEHLAPKIIKVLREVVATDTRLNYSLPKTKSNGTDPAEPHPVPKSDAPPSATLNPFVIPGLKRVRIPSNVPTDYTFGNLIEGDCNRLARSSAYSVARSIGNTALNPLFVYGPTGVGKTHLLWAIGNEVQRNYPDKQVLYTTMESFTNHFIESLRNNAAADFSTFYHQIDVLLLDDIHRLNGKQKMQDIFFQIFNHMHHQKKQLVLTSDRAPKDLEGLEERLLSRMKWGMVADIQQPDYELRLAIVFAKLNEAGVEVPVEVAEYLAKHLRQHVRELQSGVLGIINESLFTNREIDMELAHQVVSRIVDISSHRQPITAQRIQELVCEEFGVTQGDLLGPRRLRTFVEARQTAMYLCRQMTNLSLKAIAEVFDRRDHTTVMHACDTVANLRDVDSTFQNRLKAIEARLNEAS